MNKLICKPSSSFWHTNSTKYFQNAYCAFMQHKRQFHNTEKLLTPSLVVSPLDCLYDVKPSIRVEGLEPQRPITLKAQMREDKGKLLYSNAHYVADNDGVVDVSVSSSLNGTYKGVFPTGLLSSLKIAAGHFEFGRIHKKNMFEPIKIKISVLDGHKPIEVDEGELDSVEMQRHLVGKGVQRIPVREGNVRGVLYLPEGEGPFPGVIDMFGATGTLIETRAALNASRGIASLALAYFAYDDIPVERINNLDIAYVEEAVDYLLSHPKVKSERCGIVGNCLGGLLAYNTGVHVSKLKAIFVVNASHNIYVGDLKYKGNIISSFYPDLEDIFVSNSEGVYTVSEKYRNAINIIQPSDVHAFNNTLDDQYFTIAVGGQCPYQFQRGWSEISKQISDKKKKNFTLKVYRKAGHTVNVPYTPFFPIVNSPIYIPLPKYRNNVLLNLDGERFESIIMQADVWQAMYEFFQTHLK